MRARAVVLGIASVLLVACRGEQELHDDCPTAGSACPACTRDEECGIVSNACHAHATCTSRARKPTLAVDQLGCSLEYDVPPAERCGCVAGVCRAR